ncbi:hypothetical protein NM688_g1755 [Phlebia brevispora]|uniref:Uncharacterized protein n=1 Tax=Phlebia brevispora TaxID=194682 RepID=A0ACC1TB78_9APHY|nr:hypothetical protein NM688_g1755 [Phlebia brevispora]
MFQMQPPALQSLTHHVSAQSPAVLPLMRQPLVHIRQPLVATQSIPDLFSIQPDAFQPTPWPPPLVPEISAYYGQMTLYQQMQLAQEAYIVQQRAKTLESERQQRVAWEAQQCHAQASLEAQQCQAHAFMLQQN